MALAIADEKPEAHVIGADLVLPMLKLARKKIADRNRSDQAFLVQADALDLPFPDKIFDSVTIAFGIRNIQDRPAALKEMRRVLTPSGRAVILELTFPRRWPFFPAIYRSYLKLVLPLVGKLIAKDMRAYQYLAESILDFPTAPEFREFMSQAGFVHTGFRELTFGGCVIWWGDKPA